MPCFSHDQCLTGFCYQGSCIRNRFGDPCMSGTCDEGTCNPIIRRCVDPKKSLPPVGRCHSESDCSPDEYCKASRCYTRPTDDCTPETGCLGPNECYDDKCVKRCVYNSDCDSGYWCNLDTGLRSGYGVCSKEKMWIFSGRMVFLGVVIVLVVSLVIAAIVFIRNISRKKRAIPPPPSSPGNYGSSMSPVVATPIVAPPDYAQHPSTPPPYAQESSSYQMPQKY